MNALTEIVSTFLRFELSNHTNRNHRHDQKDDCHSPSISTSSIAAFNAMFREGEARVDGNTTIFLVCVLI